MRETEYAMHIPFQYAATLYALKARDVLHGFERELVDEIFLRSYVEKIAPAAKNIVRGNTDAESPLGIIRSLANQESQHDEEGVHHLWLCIILAFMGEFYDTLDAPAKLLDYALDRVQPFDHPLELRLALIALRGNAETYERLVSQAPTSSDHALKALIATTRKNACLEKKAT